LSDPIAVGGSFGVDTRVARVGTTVAPRDYPVKIALEVERAARVTLTRVDTTLIKTGADLTCWNSAKAAVGSVAGSSVVDGHVNLQEDVRRNSSGLQN